MKQVIIVLPAGRPIIMAEGVTGVLAEDTEIVFDVHDAELAHPGIIDPEDVVAQALVATNPELIPLLTHEGEDDAGKDVLIGYTPSGTRVVGVEENPVAESDTSDDEEESAMETDPAKLARRGREELDELATAAGLDSTTFPNKLALAEAIIAASGE